MPKISLTSLADIASVLGPQKLTKVRALKKRPPYSPATDFYKPLRAALIAAHDNGGTKADLLEVPHEQADLKKVANYVAAVNGYNKWWGQKSIKSFEVRRDTYSKNGIDVTVNPEVGLDAGANQYIVKYYLNAVPLDSFRANLITALMEIALRAKTGPAPVMAVLDVRQGKLYTMSSKLEALKTIVDAEIGYVAGLWDAA